MNQLNLETLDTMEVLQSDAYWVGFFGGVMLVLAVATFIVACVSFL